MIVFVAILVSDVHSVSNIHICGRYIFKFYRACGQHASAGLCIEESGKSLLVSLRHHGLTGHIVYHLRRNDLHHLSNMRSIGQVWYKHRDLTSIAWPVSTGIKLIQVRQYIASGRINALRTKRICSIGRIENRSAEFSFSITAGYQAKVAKVGIAVDDTGFAAVVTFDSNTAENSKHRNQLCVSVVGYVYTVAALVDLCVGIVYKRLYRTAITDHCSVH